MTGLALKHVNMSTDVYFVCLNHAMSTDGEEIVGLLVGEVDEHRVAHIVTVVILRRSDKRKDRVEISPEQLSNASTEAERLACILKRPIRVIGWYHSHPKLTVWPSPIDVNTQDSYQLMDEGFIGVIFSVFNEDPNKKGWQYNEAMKKFYIKGGRIQMTCFQSQTVIDENNIEKRRLDIPVHLVPSSCISNVCMTALIQLPRYLCQEEQLAYQLTSQVPLDYLTRLHNSSVYIKSMGQIAEVICGPLLKMLEERIINNEIKRKNLLERKKQLMTFIDQARIDKVHKEQEQLKKKDAPTPTTSTTEIDPTCTASVTSERETQVKIPDSDIILTSNPTVSTEYSDIDSSEKSSEDYGSGAKYSNSPSPVKSEVTSDESENNNSFDVATCDEIQFDKIEQESTIISEQKESNTCAKNIEGSDKNQLS